MSYSFFLARKLSLASEGRKSSPAIRVAVTAVALSVAVMIAAIAIILGFKREIRDKVIGFNSHLSVYAIPTDPADNNLITLTPTLRTILDSKEYVTDYALEASIPAILKTPDNFKGVYLKSSEGETISKFLAANLISGKMPDYTKDSDTEKILISQKTADQLNLSTGDKIDTYFMTGSIRVRRLEISGIFNSHFDSYDNVLIYGALPLIQSLGDLSNTQGTSISINVSDFDNLDNYAIDLSGTFADAIASGMIYKYYRVETATNQGAGYFRWLQLLDTNVIVILTLMTIVAVVTLISGMLIIILDKKRFIGLVRSMGASVRSVRKVFIFMALRIAIWGLLIGNIIAICILWAQDRWHLIPLDADSYYIDFVPVELSWISILILNIATLLIIYLSLILPSWLAAKISPAETMRYE
ncbi:MAG: ABC transporter permease [Bacteroides sp.]|nr:ABC transporter permease [Bacteroidales bacterium]MBD5341153.1 ABC transporter permease [Bacteroides sp.]